MTGLDEATRNQIDAADPSGSVWLTANAGSGKTKVLTDRVTRLLLDGVDPEGILCLTYTKAAAAEMQNRLFGRLGDWAMMEDGKLREALAATGFADTADLARARTLFARAIETPGGIKIQTIHAFCAMLLRRFPLEAGVSPGFRELDDAAAAELRGRVIERLAETDAPVIEGVARHLSTDDLTAFALEVAANPGAFPPDLDRQALAVCLGISPDESAHRQFAQLIGPSGPETIAALKTALATGGAYDLRDLKKLRTVEPRNLLPDDHAVLEGVFLTQSGKAAFTAKTDKFPTKAARPALGNHIGPLQEMMYRAETLREPRLALLALEKADALRRFAQAFLPAYEAAKARRGVLDFSDLIARANRLLADETVASWVLYRIDGDIDHILIDEAQDTSPEQWDVIRRLTAEMTAGKGARENARRTLFVVGDLKQSIYSFQGADPEAMGRMHTHFSNRPVGDAGLATRKLEHSFRSAPAILSVVDATFTGSRAAGLGDAVAHIPFKTALPGRVDLWPLETPADAEDEKEWYDPVDRLQASAPSARLARRIAAEVRRWVDTGTLPDGDGNARRITESDVLILVQGRNALFHQIIRACKAAGLTVAGADRMRIQSELAARDIVGTLAFLALPEDDLSLAAALRSPLFGWTERDLYRLAQPRGEAFLWEALRNSPDHASTRTVLDDLLRRADFDRPLELVERLLTRHGGRARLLARLGPEAEEGIDALIDETMRYEKAGPPSLTGFLAWHERQDTDIKRQAGGAGAGLRVMTVHGAKGLESPIVILPDTLRDERERPRTILKSEDGLPLWSVPAAERPAALAGAARARAEAEADERRRLLYVAMTRAESWLVVAGAGKPPSKGETWYEAVEEGMAAAGAATVRLEDGGEICRLETGTWIGVAATEAPAPSAGPALPPWLDTERAAPQKESPLKPSDLEGEKTLPGEPGDEGPEDPRAYGTALHLLLEHLSGMAADLRADVARRLLPLEDEVNRARLLADACRLLDDPALAAVFAPHSLAEVPFAATSGGRPMVGTIDRLVVSQDRVLAVDFKSNRVVPDRPEDTPEGILRQMAAYMTALSAIFPGRQVETAVLWTAPGTLMYLPHDIVRAAAPTDATS